MYKYLFLVLTCTLTACATAKPSKLSPAELPADLPEDDFIAYSQQGDITHSCANTGAGKLLCRDHTSPAEQKPPSGVLVQDGIRVVGPETLAPESKSALPINTRLALPTYDYKVRITRKALWLDDQKLVEFADGRVPAEAKIGGERSLLITPLKEAVDATTKETAETPKMIIVVDQTTPYRILTEVMYTLGKTDLLRGADGSLELLATVEARDTLYLDCEKANASAEYPLTCRPVAAENRDAAGVSRVELVRVGYLPVNLPRLSGAQLSKIAKVKNFCDKDHIRRVIANSSDALRYCWDKEREKNPDLSGKIMAQFKLGLDGKVMSSSIANSTMDNEAVETCIVRVLKTLEFKKPAGGICIINYPFVFGAE